MSKALKIVDESTISKDIPLKFPELPFIVKDYDDDTLWLIFFDDYTNNYGYINLFDGEKYGNHDSLKFLFKERFANSVILDTEIKIKGEWKGE